MFALLLALGCGGSPAPAPARPSPPPVATSQTTATAPADVIKRSDVVAWVDAGFGRFLQKVAVEPSLEAGRFRGWTILELRPAEFWQRVDLQPGDVVRSVNGLPLEREIEAWEAFESLRTADELSVAYQRGGAQRSFRYRILD
jgi:type II secretory pathway component PulC